MAVKYQFLLIKFRFAFLPETIALTAVITFLYQAQSFVNPTVRLLTAVSNCNPIAYHHHNSSHKHVEGNHWD